MSSNNIEYTKVFIDAGHGHPDPGAVNEDLGLQEKNIVLGIAEYANERLQSYGATTEMSRTGDSRLDPNNYSNDLDLRVERSNDFGANIFVSIHNNAAGDSSANGIETLIHPEASSYNRQLASDVNSMVVTRTDLDSRPYPVRERSNVRVLYQDNQAWAILVEVGFISNLSDAQKLATTSTQQAAGYAIAEAIRNFMNSQPPMY